MSYEVSGVIKTILPVQTGTSKTSGEEWKKIEFVVANNDGYQGKEQLFCFQIFGADKVDNFLKYKNEGANVNVKFIVQTNEWKGKYFTSLSAFHVQSGEAVEQATYTPTQPKQVVPVSVDDVGEDDLPF